MKSIIRFSLLMFAIVFFAASCFNSSEKGQFEDGDIIFQMSQSSQCDAVCLATESEFSHVGMIYRDADKYFVLEAVQPVCVTPLDDWIQRGKDSRYVVKRLKNSKKVLTPANKSKMMEMAKAMLGKNYDSYFMWSDENMYCSELIWKLYYRCCGVEIGKPKKLKDFSLESETVKNLMQERYGNNVPLEEKVISPGDMYDCEKLVVVHE